MLLASALVALLSWAYLRGRPVALPEAGEARLPCVSYAPFRRDGHTPFDPDLRLTPDQIAADLRLLAEVSGCVRTYGLDHGVDAVPAVARKLGLRVLLGAWIGRDPAANAAQVERALELARTHADVVELLVIGNEVLLRRELAPESLGALLARAKREAAVPVTYADVWEFWLRHASALREHVDVVAAHVLPYWEDRPVGVADAVDHVYSIARELRAVFDPLPVVIAETGWPAAGRQRGPARPGHLEQARFVRAMLVRQAIEPLPFNLIEGFDQPWKRALEGAMGGAWGVFDQRGELRLARSGPVVPDREWWQVPLAAALGAVVGLLWAGSRRRARREAAASRTANCIRATAWPLGGAGIAAVAVLQGRALALWSRDPLEWALGSVAVVAAIACSVAATARLADASHVAPPVERPGVVAALRRGARAAALARTLALAQFAWLFVAAADALALVFDGRYRPLAWPNLAAPSLLLLALALHGDRLGGHAREERLLAAVCGGCAPALLVQEGLRNAEALLVAALLLATAAAVLWRHRAAPAAGDGRTSTSAASRAAGAASGVE